MTRALHRSTAPDPERYSNSGTEDAHSISLAMWARKNIDKYPELAWLFHIPNGGMRTKSGAGKLKAMGVKSGVPDYCLPIRRHEYGSLWIELKKPKSNKGPAGRTSSEQNVWIDHLKTQGFGAVVCVGWEAARDMIVSYLEYKGKSK